MSATIDPEDILSSLDDTPPPVEFENVPSSLFEVTDGHKDGKRRVKNPKGGFPIVMLPGETPEQAVERFERKRAENTAASRKNSKTRAREQARAKAGKPIEDRLPPQKDRSAGDPLPKVENAPSGSSIASKVTDAQLKEAWEEICTLPGLYFGMPVHDHALDKPLAVNPNDPSAGYRVMPGFRPRCEYCRDHFFTTGAPMADELLKMGEQNPAIKRWLTRGYHAYAALTGGAVVAMYLGKPIMHHLGPETVTNQVAAMAGPFMAIKTQDGRVLHPAMPPRPKHERRPGPPRQGGRFKRKPRPRGTGPSAATASPLQPSGFAPESGGTAQTI